jgi:hypothetical protein
LGIDNVDTLLVIASNGDWEYFEVDKYQFGKAVENSRTGVTAIIVVGFCNF